MCEIDGKISLENYKNKRRVIITSLDEMNFEILIPRSNTSMWEGDFVKKGDILVEGTPVPHDILSFGS